MISDPEFRLENAIKIKNMPSVLDDLEVSTLESATEIKVVDVERLGLKMIHLDSVLR